MPPSAFDVVVAFSGMGPGAAERIRTEVCRLAGERGLAEHAVHRAATAPIPSAAIELRATGAAAVPSTRGRP